jgi:hypothetical protein
MDRKIVQIPLLCPATLVLDPAIRWEVAQDRCPGPENPRKISSRRSKWIKYEWYQWYIHLVILYLICQVIWWNLSVPYLSYDIHIPYIYIEFSEYFGWHNHPSSGFLREHPRLFERTKLTLQGRRLENDWSKPWMGSGNFYSRESMYIYIYDMYVCKYKYIYIYHIILYISYYIYYIYIYIHL